MKKLVFLIAALTSVMGSAAFAAESAPRTDAGKIWPQQSVLVQAGTMLKINRLCERPVPEADVRALSDVFLAATVNPTLVRFSGTDGELLKTIVSPTPELSAAVEADRVALGQAIDKLNVQHETLGSVCTPELSADVAGFLKDLRADGRLATATRQVAVMLESSCATLGCRR